MLAAVQPLPAAPRQGGHVVAGERHRAPLDGAARRAARRARPGRSASCRCRTRRPARRSRRRGRVSETPRTAVAAPSCTVTCRSSRRSTSSGARAAGPAWSPRSGRPGQASWRLSIVTDSVGFGDRLGQQRASPALPRSRKASASAFSAPTVMAMSSAGDERRPRRLGQVVEVGGEHAAPGRGGRLDADAEEGQERHREQRGARSWTPWSPRWSAAPCAARAPG